MFAILSHLFAASQYFEAHKISMISNLTLDFQSWDTFTPKAPSSSGDNKTATPTSGGNVSEALLRKNTTSMVFGRQLKAIQVKRLTFAFSR